MCIRDRFLDEAYKGTVINNQELVAQDSGLIDDFVNDSSRKVYDAIAGPVVKLNHLLQAEQTLVQESWL